MRLDNCTYMGDKFIDVDTGVIKCVRATYEVIEDKGYMYTMMDGKLYRFKCLNEQVLSQSYEYTTCTVIKIKGYILSESDMEQADNSLIEMLLNM